MMPASSGMEDVLLQIIKDYQGEAEDAARPATIECHAKATTQT